MNLPLFADSESHQPKPPAPGGRVRAGTSAPARSSRGGPLRDALRPPGPVRFDLSCHPDAGGRPVLRVRGEVDVLTAPKLAARLDDVVRQSERDVVVDLRELEFIDSAGLHVLLNTQRRLIRRGRRLSVVCGGGAVRNVIELARLADTLGVIADPE